MTGTKEIEGERRKRWLTFFLVFKGFFSPKKTENLLSSEKKNNVLSGQWRCEGVTIQTAISHLSPSVSQFSDFYQLSPFASFVLLNNTTIMYYHHSLVKSVNILLVKTGNKTLMIKKHYCSFYCIGIYLKCSNCNPF